MDAVTLNGPVEPEPSGAVHEYGYDRGQRALFEFMFIAGAIAAYALGLFALHSWRLLLLAIAAAAIALESLVEFRRRLKTRFVVDEASITAVYGKGDETRVAFEDACLLRYRDERKRSQVVVLPRDGGAIWIPREIAGFDTLQWTLGRKIKEVSRADYIHDTRVNHLVRPLQFRYPDRPMLSYFLVCLAIIVSSIPSEEGVLEWEFPIIFSLGLVGTLIGLFAGRGVFPSTRCLEVTRDGLSYRDLFGKREFGYSDVTDITLTAKRLIIRSVYGRITYPMRSIHGQRLLRILRAHCPLVAGIEARTLPWELAAAYGPRGLLKHAVVGWVALAFIGTAALVVFGYVPGAPDEFAPVVDTLSVPVVLGEVTAMIVCLSLILLLASSAYRVKKYVFTKEYIQRHGLIRVKSFPVNSLKKIAVEVESATNVEKSHVLLVFRVGTLRIIDGSVKLPLLEVFETLRSLYPHVQTED